MTLKIGPMPPLPPTAAATEAGAGAARGSATAPGRLAAPEAAQDKATVSSAGAQISAMAGTTDFDTAKVEAIRQAIREGRFSVNAEAIADRLIDEASALLGGPRTH